MKRNKFFIVVMASVFTGPILSGCFTDWAGEGSITIGTQSQSTTGISRTLVTDNEAALYLRYDYTLNGPGGIINGSVSGTQKAVVSVIPGNWEITVKAYGKKHGNPTATDIVLRGMGSTNVVVKSGKNETAIVKLITTTEITSWDDFSDAVGGSPLNAREEIIIIKNDLTVAGSATIDRKITILTDGIPVTIRRDPNYGGRFFDISTNAYLVLGKAGLASGTLVFDGNDGLMAIGTSVTDAIIYMGYGGGIVVINDGVKLMRNNNNYMSSGLGGGVEMYNGTLVMNGGEIANNTAASGGGVFINSSLGSTITFTMNGGSITGNTATNGGGIYMYGGYGSETFTINNGIINGNSASFGDGLYKGAGTVFNNNGGTINDTIYP